MRPAILYPGIVFYKNCSRFCNSIIAYDTHRNRFHVNGFIGRFYLFLIDFMRKMVYTI